MREVKLKINPKEILEAYRAISNKDSKISLKHPNIIEYLTVIKNILGGSSLEIESNHTAEEKEEILEIFKNDVWYYFMCSKDQYVKDTIFGLHKALMERKKRELAKQNKHSLFGEEEIKTQYETIRFINKLIEINPAIFNKEHGMDVQFDKSIKADYINPNITDPDLSTKSYTIRIDGTKFSSLKNLLRSTQETIIQEVFFSISDPKPPLDIDTLYRHSSAKEHYTLDKLYTNTHDETGMLLVDHGLNLIFEKYYEIVELVDQVKPAKDSASNLLEITAKINELFFAKDLKIVTSVIKSMKEIRKEKEVHSCIFKALEYMANNPPLLNANDGSNTVQIDKDLSNFNTNYITRDYTGLHQTVSDKRDELRIQINSMHTDALNKVEEYFRRKDIFDLWECKDGEDVQKFTQEKEKEAGELKILDREINTLHKKRYLLECKLKEEDLQHSNVLNLVRNLQKLLSEITLPQKEYIAKKMEKFEEMKNMEPEEEVNDMIFQEEPRFEEAEKGTGFFSMDPTPQNILKMFAIAAVFIATSILLCVSQSKDGIMKLLRNE
ncbi:hypothetical protein NEMIN01_0690 [Nematocida minor]|uniref:uncharacterized protein n=1 Tax=Nematocida minor TaxID=1912983 RepID=UPI00221E57F3|nr:uncharacterized protein NEMIN01_0690 [Nematocida minor]KAI5189827.1 hypothetical protein NEMIN01_0690 [Nematocida minor]